MSQKIRLIRTGKCLRYPEPPDTVEYATRYVDQRLSKGEGVVCPVSGVHLIVRPRRLNAGMARALIFMYRAWGTGKWGPLPELQVWVAQRHPEERRPGRKFHPLGGEEAKLRYWDLVEQHPTLPAHYRVTDEGEDFAEGRSLVPKFALVLNDAGRCFGLRGEPWSVRQALGDKFNLEQLLKETPFHIPVTQLRLVRRSNARR